MNLKGLLKKSLKLCLAGFLLVPGSLAFAEPLLLDPNAPVELKPLEETQKPQVKLSIGYNNLSPREKRKLQRKLEKEERDIQRALKKKEREISKINKARERAAKKEAKALSRAKKEEEKLAKRKLKAKTIEPIKFEEPASSDNLITSEIKTRDLVNSGAPVKLDEFDLKRNEVRNDEQEALDFIFPSIEEEAEELLASEEFFTKTEKDQLLELWRATIARNRTIQFIIKSLAPGSDNFEKNNAIIQTLSKAIFVPFYAVAAVTDASLINSGSLVGARVIGDVVDDFNAKRSRTREITNAEMAIMFMLVDEVAERLRTSFRDYKLVKIEQDFLKQELKEAQYDAGESIDLKGEGSALAQYFTRKIVRNIQSDLRRLEISTRRKRSTLVELAGTDAVASVDVLIDLEVETMLSDITSI